MKAGASAKGLGIVARELALDVATRVYEAQVAKPDPKLYEAALKRATHARRLLHGKDLPAIKPEEMLHIGDDLTNDYLAAKAAGWQAILVDPKGEAQHQARLAPTALSTAAYRIDF